jgi:monoamine oxidase
MPSPSPTQRYDTIIIGAGAAGLAAAQRLQAAGQTVLVLEARDRVGGRVQTDYEFASHPVELGAEFVHGDVVTGDLAAQYGLALMPALGDDRAYIHDVDGLKTVDDYAQGEAAIARQVMQSNDSEVWQWAEDWVKAGQPDTDVATMVRSRGITLPPVVEQIVSHTYSADYGVYWDRLGVYGMVENSYEGDGCAEYRIREGYGAVIEGLAEGLTVKLNTVVRAIDWAESGVRVVADDDVVFVADQAIITLPLASLQNNAVKFTPELPDWKKQAIDGIGISHIIKLILKFDAPFWPADWEHCHTYLDTQLWWRSGYGFESEAPIITAFVGDMGGDRLRAMGEAKATALGVWHLAQMFGVDLRGRLVAAKLVDWSADPYIQMGYSHTAVGGTGLREKLGQSIDDRLFFAGEATSVLRPGTVHGAIESGWAVADAICGNITAPN